MPEIEAFGILRARIEQLQEQRDHLLGELKENRSYLYEKFYKIIDACLVMFAQERARLQDDMAARDLVIEQVKGLFEE